MISRVASGGVVCFFIILMKSLMSLMCEGVMVRIFYKYVVHHACEFLSGT